MKEKPHREKIWVFFLLETLKTIFKMRNLIQDGHNQGIFFLSLVYSNLWKDLLWQSHNHQFSLLLYQHQHHFLTLYHLRYHQFNLAYHQSYPPGCHYLCHLHLQLSSAEHFFLLLGLKILGSIIVGLEPSLLHAILLHSDLITLWHDGHCFKFLA